jgi:hypothetical protein
MLRPSRHGRGAIAPRRSGLDLLIAVTACEQAGHRRTPELSPCCFNNTADPEASGHDARAGRRRKAW